MSYKNASARTVDGNPITLYTVPEGRVALLRSLLLAAVSTTDAVVSVIWTDASASGVGTTLVGRGALPTGVMLGMLEAPLVLEAGDSLSVAAVEGQVHATLSLMEVAA